jgi:hypothetical protein
MKFTTPASRAPGSWSVGTIRAQRASSALVSASLKNLRGLCVHEQASEVPAAEAAAA